MSNRGHSPILLYARSSFWSVFHNGLLFFCLCWLLCRCTRFLNRSPLHLYWFGFGTRLSFPTLGCLMSNPLTGCTQTWFPFIFNINSNHLLLFIHKFDRGRK
ncbi:hypothetical protein RND81_07G029500 [Saponaria officinalis]|uniref:Uncharacterized protein n=1 Tax=Saponaria officinalis TaxID=3572 RepID=A0AAW1JLJ4_SAPOF